MEKLDQGVLTPAFGRDYSSAAAAKADFVSGKDFVLNTPWGSTLCSCRDFAPGAQITIRYAKLRKGVVFTFPKE